MLSTSNNIFSKSWSKFNERFYIQSPSSTKPTTKQQQKLNQQHKKNSFSQDIRRGLTSETFDLVNNNHKSGDSRPGVDGDRIEEIMEASGCSFDEARWLFFCMQCFENNIDPISGLPMDPKAVHCI